MDAPDAPMSRPVVVGGSSGIGAAIVSSYKENGVHPLVWDIAGARDVECDVANVDSVRSALAETVELSGVPQQLTITAGIGHAGLLLDETAESWDAVMSVNARGSWLVMQTVAKAMIDAGTKGSIVATSSISAHLAERGMGLYCASKAALSMVVRIAALEWAPFGIRVNAVGPGVTRTPMLGGASADRGWLRRVPSRTALGRLAEASDISPAVLALHSLEWVTGQVLDCDGGLSLHSPIDAFGDSQRCRRTQMMGSELQALTYGDIDDRTRPLAILVHGFPDTPNTWRHLGPALAAVGWRVAAPWLRGYRSAHAGPISAGTYVQDVLDLRERLGGDARCILIGHDWGANAGYGAVSTDPDAFARLVTLAVPPVNALREEMFDYIQVRRSFYIWLIQLHGIAEAAMLRPDFLESLWHDWSPGYDSTKDLIELRRHLDDETISGVIAPYRAAFDPTAADPGAAEMASAALSDPTIPTLYLHGAKDGALGADVLGDVQTHLPAKGSSFRIVDDVGHFLHLEKPDLIEELVLSWLSSAG